jgi:uncharacterized protein YegL
MQLVIDTLSKLLEFMNETDRLSLITFNGSAQRITPLKRVSPQNKSYFTDKIRGLSAGGGTCIDAGMNQAFKTFKDRKY